MVRQVNYAGRQHESALAVLDTASQVNNDGHRPFDKLRVTNALYLISLDGGVLLPNCSIHLKSIRPRLGLRYPKELKTIGDHLKKKRLDMGLNQGEAAKVLSVSKITVSEWETNTKEPPISFIPKIVSFLGYVPFIKKKE